MFNPLRADELISALGRVLRMAADGEGPTDAYRRSQLLSAHSIARHLAAEEAARANLLEWLRSELLQILDEDRASLRAARDQIAAAGDTAIIGEVLVILLDGLGSGSEDQGLRRRLHVLFAEMADREVEALNRGTS